MIRGAFEFPMFCTRCGMQLEERAYFCSQCGTSTGRGPSPVAQKQLVRSVQNKKIAGVCGGFAEHIDADPTVVRLLWVILSLGLPPAGILGYIIAWMIIPKETQAPVAYSPVSVSPQG